VNKMLLISGTVCASSLICFKRHLEKLHKDESFHIDCCSLFDSRGWASLSPLWWARPHLV